MGNIKVGNNEISVGAILIVVGALVALISLFLGYVTVETPTLGGWDTMFGNSQRARGMILADLSELS